MGVKSLRVRFYPKIMTFPHWGISPISFLYLTSTYAILRIDLNANHTNIHKQVGKWELKGGP